MRTISSTTVPLSPASPLITRESLTWCQLVSCGGPETQWKWSLFARFGGIFVGLCFWPFCIRAHLIDLTWPIQTTGNFKSKLCEVIVDARSSGPNFGFSMKVVYLFCITCFWFEGQLYLVHKQNEVRFEIFSNPSHFGFAFEVWPWAKRQILSLEQVFVEYFRGRLMGPEAYMEQKEIKLKPSVASITAKGHHMIIIITLKRSEHLDIVIWPCTSLKRLCQKGTVDYPQKSLTYSKSFVHLCKPNICANEHVSGIGMMSPHLIVYRQDSHVESESCCQYNCFLEESSDGNYM